MTDFLNRHTLHLTPLSPIHLGTGEDFEPTNYVIHDNALYAFDPVQAELDDWQRQELLKLVRRINAKNDMERLAQIKNHIQKNAKHFIRGAYSISSTTNKLAEEYQEPKDNQFRIERTATNPHSHAPYIPGSALKGCLRTTLLDARSEKHQGEAPTSKTADRFEKQHLGSFATDLLRLVKPSDLFATNDTATHICYAINHKKKEIIGKDGRPVEGKGVTGRRETIQHGQYRAFSGSLALQNLLLDHRPQLKDADKKLPSETSPNITRLICAANHYHLTRFAQESALLIERGLVQPEWQRSTERLLEALKPELDSGTILLVRLGKNGGAESKTLEKYAQIKIMSAKGAKPTYEKHSKTVWLAAENTGEQKNLLPFGWALIEIDPTGDNDALQKWCKENSAHLKDAAVLREKLRAAQNAKAEQAAKNAAEAAAKAAALAAEHAEKAAAAQAEAARLASLSPAKRLAEEILALVQAHGENYNPRAYVKNDACYHTLREKLAAIPSELPDLAAQKEFAEALPYLTLAAACKALFTAKREKETKATLRQLRGE